MDDERPVVGQHPLELLASLHPQRLRPSEDVQVLLHTLDDGPYVRAVAARRDHEEVRDTDDVAHIDHHDVFGQLVVRCLGSQDRQGARIVPEFLRWFQ